MIGETRINGAAVGKYLPLVVGSVSNAEKMDWIARAIAEGYKPEQPVKICDLAPLFNVSKDLTGRAVQLCARAGIVYRSGSIYWRSKKDATDFLNEKRDALDVAAYRPPVAYYHKRADGNVFKWYPLGTVLDLDGRKLAVLKSGRNHAQYCAGCYLLNVSPQDCQRLKNECLGECYSIDRGDDTRVIFHAIGAGITNEQTASANACAGLSRLF
ncbi:hypothetical protein IJ103_00060 [Candidatus Saccharibacteria bacterium]|nr:hypothetical protein [Candidatus Saccharibacteria bacterium]